MIFGGLQKSSLIDFPGKVSCVLFLSGCNFDCPYCHNPDLVRGRLSNYSHLDAHGFYGFLEARKGLLDGVVVSGGEPTLEKDLALLCEKIKRMGFSVKLDTNGSRPQVIGRLIDDGLVDYIAMDIKTDPFRYSPFVTADYHADDILSSIQMIMASSLPYEFRTTCVKPIVGKRDVENIARVISDAKLYILQPFSNKQMLHPEFFRKTTPGYDMDELMHLRSIAEPMVKACLVR